MARATIDRLIVNSPYEEPARHWRHGRTTRLFDLADRRRPAGYVVASQDSKAFDDPGVFVEIPLVNRIRERVRAWRTAAVREPPWRAYVVREPHFGPDKKRTSRALPTSHLGGHATETGGVARDVSSPHFSVRLVWTYPCRLGSRGFPPARE